MARRLLCGHNSDWTVRLVDRGKRFIFCLGCLFEKMDMTSIDGKKPPKIVSQNDKIKAAEEEKQSSKKEKPTEVDKNESDNKTSEKA